MVFIVYFFRGDFNGNFLFSKLILYRNINATKEYNFKHVSLFLIYFFLMSTAKDDIEEEKTEQLECIIING